MNHMHAVPAYLWVVGFSSLLAVELLKQDDETFLWEPGMGRGVVNLILLILQSLLLTAPGCALCPGYNPRGVWCVLSYY